MLLAGHYLEAPRKMLVVAANYDRALQWQAKLEICGIPHGDILILPSGNSSLFEDAAPEHIALSDRLGALRLLASDQPCIVIATPQAALERTLPLEVLQDALLEIRKGDILDGDDLIRRLVRLGYEPAEPVRHPGQYSRRGGILDLYPTGRDLPVRLEFFGDEVESLRVFDPNTQKSVGHIEAFSLAPSRETLYVAGHEDLRDLVLESVQREATLLDDEAAARLEEMIRGDAEALAAQVYFDRLDLYRPLLHPDSGCAVDLLGEEGLLVLDEPLELESIAVRSEEELGQALKARHNRGEILFSTANDFVVPPEHFAAARRILSMSAMNALPDWLSLPQRVDLRAISLDPYRGRSEALALTLRNWAREGVVSVFATDQPHRAKSVLEGAEIFPFDSLPTEGEASGAYLAHGNLGGGFMLQEEKLALVTDAELFGVARLKLPNRRFMEGAPVATVLDLKPGDYVVHIHFGIGIFRGLVKRPEQGVEKEFLLIEYQAPDKLFVPADQLDRIQKYLNPGDERPKLNRLTGGEWQRTLGKAKEEAKEFARELVRLYAARKRVQRKPYSPDSPFQAEMEATFPWVETPGQALAIEETKKDMELPWPMDRLICGDVGFGKTEVAIRAAFKAVQDRRQVAVLCPTTILSEQHFRNFSERLGGFGVRLALLNRYVTGHEKRDVENRLKTGELDVVIGTHALLGSSIEFHDLGLVVIDEEQKFGVKQKELLKKLRTEVDVLTLSATPIPRTLSMSLMDIRQMSLINDPPPGRLPVRSYVRPYSQEVIREAILRELARGGQVFYVYNRVESIGHVAERLRQLVPTARIGVGHGQMSERELEPIMIGFIKGEIDILLSTTIIENGIDISNANTLIVENADRLGLSQLYQLRGRVGRSDRQAYAYFLYSHGKDLTEGGMQRLQALQEFSSLGAGYSLAFRDLQIRGAGELLGAKQHGAMANVGYDLYTQLINEAVATLKNSVDGAPLDEVKDPLASLEPLPQFDLPVVALLPDTYIQDQAQRLFYYQKMMGCRDEATLGTIQSEVEDRYGHAPTEVHNAFAIMAQRIQARDLGIDKLEARQGRLSIRFRPDADIPPRVISLVAKKNRDAYFSAGQYIWPYTGNPILAVEKLLMTFQEAFRQLEAERALLA
jgi:transcription-repair coupling factor (superfamily II helicase)